ncbi:MAG: type II toxin-antitoxin system VapC family toxin [Acidobacteria bacterium]|nr:type II toxin-antitoxin system VapC family toxin [Acidobacteriota bacterium]
MSNLVIFDTSIFVDQLRTGRHQQRVLATMGLVRTSAVVLAELWRGANTSAERKFLRSLERNHPILVPTSINWLASGEILQKMRAAKGFALEKLRDLHFDVLIALTARSFGARLITSNRTDFELIAGYVPVQLEIWP